MKKFFLGFLLLAGLSSAQIFPQAASSIRKGAVLPTTCRDSQVFFVNNTGMYQCIAGVWTVVPTSGGGDVVGPSSATDNALARFDTTTGKLIQNSLVTVSDTGTILTPASINTSFAPSGTSSFMGYWGAAAANFSATIQTEISLSGAVMALYRPVSQAAAFRVVLAQNGSNVNGVSISGHLDCSGTMSNCNGAEDTLDLTGGAVAQSAGYGVQVNASAGTHPTVYSYLAYPLTVTGGTVGLGIGLGLAAPAVSGGGALTTYLPFFINGRPGGSDTSYLVDSDFAIGITQRTTAGQTDSKTFLLGGSAYDTGVHSADWRQFVDITSNAAASTYRLQSRVDSASFTDRLTVADTGDISTPGSIALGVGGTVAGFAQFGQGTAPSAGTTAITFYGDSSVTSYIVKIPGTAGTGFILNTDTSNSDVWSYVGFTGTGNVVRATSATLVTPALGTPSALVLTNATGLPSAQVPAVPLTAGTSVTLSENHRYFVCTGTCTVTVPVPAAGVEYCVYNDDNVATVITLAAIGSSARYENTARTAYGTSSTGTFVSGGAVADKVCIVGRDSTHYSTLAYNGTWVAN